MSDPTLSALAIPLKLFVKAAFPRARQLHAERQAGQASFQGPADFMNLLLNKTLDRLQGGNIDDAWWSSLLYRLGQKYIVPEFLKNPHCRNGLPRNTSRMT